MLTAKPWPGGGPPRRRPRATRAPSFFAWCGAVPAHARPLDALAGRRRPTTRRFAPSASRRGRRRSDASSVVVVATPAGVPRRVASRFSPSVVVIEAAGRDGRAGLRCLLGRSDADYDSAAIRGATLDKLWYGRWGISPRPRVIRSRTRRPSRHGTSGPPGLGDTPDLLSRRKLTFAMVGDPGSTGVFLFKADRAVARDLAELLLGATMTSTV